MLLSLPRKYRSEDDDYAPVDYTFVGSVTEGARKQQSAPIHREPERAAVRHRADPNAGADAADAPEGVNRGSAAGGPRGYDTARRLPRAGDGPASAASIAYPRPRDNGFASAPSYAPQRAEPLQAAQEQARRASAPVAAQPLRMPPTGVGMPRQTSPEADALRQTLRDAAAPAAVSTRSVRPESETPYAGAPRVIRQPDASETPPAPGYAANSHGAQPSGRTAPASSRVPANTGYGTAGNDAPPPLAAPRSLTASPLPVEPGDVFTPDGSQYAPPTAQEIPDWLRAAQQNNMPLYEDRRRRAPRVEPAPPLQAEPAPTDLLGRPIARRNPLAPVSPLPTNPEDYEAAGYPPELIAQRRNEDQAMAAQLGYGRKRHGAQLAAPPAPRAAASRAQAAPGGSNRTDWPLPANPQTEADAGISPDWRTPPRTNAYPSPGAVYDRRQARPEDASPETYRAGHAPRADFAPSAARDEGGVITGYTPYTVTDAPRAGREKPDPWGEAVDAEEEPAKPKLVIPYLGIAVFVAAALVVVLWILQITFTAQRESVLTARAATEAKLANNHPFDYRELIEQEAAANNLHPAFVAAIVLNESSFNPKAESDVGARGLMQLMPDTAAWVHGKMGLTDEYSFDQMYDPDTNVHYACWYLAFLSERFHNDPILVSAAFHAGQTTVQNWLNDSRYSVDSQSIKLENMAEGPTKSYATRVLKAYAVYRRLYYEGGLADVKTTTGAGKSGIS